MRVHTRRRLHAHSTVQRGIIIYLGSCEEDMTRTHSHVRAFPDACACECECVRVGDMMEEGSPTNKVIMIIRSALSLSMRVRSLTHTLTHLSLSLSHKSLALSSLWSFYSHVAARPCLTAPLSGILFHCRVCFLFFLPSSY